MMSTHTPLLAAGWLISKFQHNDDIKTPDDAEIIGRVVTSINIRDFRL